MKLRSEVSPVREADQYVHLIQAIFHKFMHYKVKMKIQNTQSKLIDEAACVAMEVVAAGSGQERGRAAKFERQ